MILDAYSSCPHHARFQCFMKGFALMGQYQSFHIQKFMRLPEKVGEKLDQAVPLRLVNRGAQASGRLSAKPPRKDQTLTYWSTLKTYLDTLESVLEELKPIAEKVARQNTVIVMVCNHGQVRLLQCGCVKRLSFAARYADDQYLTHIFLPLHQ